MRKLGVVFALMAAAGALGAGVMAAADDFGRVSLAKNVRFPAPRAVAADADRASASGVVKRRCWNYQKTVLDLVFLKKDVLQLTRDGKSCKVKRDPKYPSGHVPAEYQSWYRYEDGAKQDESTDWGINNPCTKVMGVQAGKDLWGVFNSLRLDSALSRADLKGSARMIVEMAGDGAGPARENLICR